MPGGPIAETELDRIFAPLAAYAAVGLAVSGGPDSTALMHLFVRWRGSRTALRAIVLTVDHGLRPKAMAEARAVAAAATALGLEAQILTWTGDKPASGTQEAARAARYRLLARASAVHGLDAIVTAHTEDDQAETMLMRLARGSGLDGLAGMAETTRFEGLTLVRPFLSIPKARLVATLDAAAIASASDPSNEDSRFERVRLRQAAPVLEGLGLTGRALALSARRLGRARQALEIATDALASAATTVDAAGVARLDRDLLTAAPAEIAIRLVERLVSGIGGPGPPISLAKVEALTSWLRSDAAGGGRTLGRVEVQLPAAVTRHAIIVREWRRRPLPEMPLEAGRSILWDGRFRIALAAGAADVLIIAGLPPGVAEDCGKGRQSLPVAMRAGRLVATPLDREQALPEGLSFEFVGRSMIFGRQFKGETQK